LKSQFATSSWGGRRKLPLAFTEHGAIMAATVLNTPRAVEVSVYVVRAFVQLRELAGSHRELAKRLDELEQKAEALALKHDALSRNTRAQLKQVFDALRDLMTPPEPPKRPIGFIAPEDQGKKARARSPESGQNRTSRIPASSTHEGSRSGRMSQAADPRDRRLHDRPTLARRMTPCEVLPASAAG
jgi:hypothetical protein